MQSTGHYTDDKISGEWIWYFKNGQPWDKGIYEHGKKARGTPAMKTGSW